MPDEEQPYRISGLVSGTDGREVSRARVRVWLDRIRSRDPLGEQETSEEGSYEIEIRVPEGTPGIPLVIVDAQWGDRATPVESPPTPVTGDLVIDLQAPLADPSVLGRLQAAVDPLLGDLTLTQIVEDSTDQDISYLAAATGIDSERIMRLVISARLEASYGVPAAVFFAFLGQGLPSGAPSSLLTASDGFRVIDSLVNQVGVQILGMDPTAQTAALNTAVDTGLVAPLANPDISTVVSKLGDLHTTNILQQPYLTGKTALTDLLDVAGLPADKKQLFATALAGNVGSMNSFWAVLTQQGFTAAEVTELRQTLELGGLVKNYLPILRTLMVAFTAGTYTTLSELATLGETDWRQLIDNSSAEGVPGYPPNLTGPTGANPADVFAQELYLRTIRTWPTAALASRASTAAFVAPAAWAALQRFFATNPSLDLRRDNLETLVAQNGGAALVGIPANDTPTVLALVRKMQRVLRLVPHPDTAMALLNAGIDSSARILAMGQGQFVAKAISTGVTSTEATMTYWRAEQRYASMFSYLGLFHAGFNQTNPAAVGSTFPTPQQTQVIAASPTLTTLFGSQDYCAISDCNSVLSPAAYLVDLLLWLRERNQTGPFPDALAALVARRPDIAQLNLDCPNTDTIVPYIDLVCELLEDVVAPPNPAQWKQTTLSEVELRAAPEYVNQAAYDTLAGASYPHTLPYDTVLDELRVYLGQANVPRWQLMELLEPLHGANDDARASQAGEFFGMNAHEVTLVTIVATAAGGAGLNTVWGQPAAATPAATVAALNGVPAFMAAANLNYEELQELLTVTWVRSGGASSALAGVNDACDTSQETITNLDPGRLDLMHRFLRVWRRSGWKMWELDLLLTNATINPDALGPKTLARLYRVARLQRTTGLGIDQLAAFYGPLDIATDHRDPDGTTPVPLYSRLFLDPTVAGDPAFEVATITAAVPAALAAHLDQVRSGLQVDQETLQSLVDMSDGNLTIANLSLMYRTTTLAAAAGLSVEDLQAAVVLLGAAGPPPDLLAPVFADPDTTWGVIEQLALLGGSGFTLAQAQYLLGPPPWETGLDDDTARTYLEAIRASLQQAQDKAVAGAAPEVTAAIPTDMTNGVSRLVAADFGLADNATAALLANLQLPGVPTSLLAILTDASLIAPAGGGPAAPGTTAYAQTIDPANFGNQYLALHLLDKAALIVNQLRMSIDEIGWLLTNRGLGAWLDLGEFPVTTPQATLPLSALFGTVTLIVLARLFGTTSVGLLDVVATASAGGTDVQLQADLANLTGLQPVDIGALVTQLAITTAPGGGAPPGGDYVDPSAYDRLRQALALQAALGVGADQVVAWAAAAPIAADAAAAQAAVKSRQTASDWLDLAPTFIDPIRDRRRQALVDWLLAQRNPADGTSMWGSSSDDLFSHFLIDVEMTSCQDTSRIVQAYASVQLFVERALLGQETPGVVADVSADSKWGEWSWMQRYVDWEANREVFLYPENWLRTIPRPDPSEIFVALQNQLSQNQVTKDTAEAALLGYLDGLEEVAHLVSTGIFVDPLDGSVHAVARTKAHPPRYFYRVQAKGTSWTPWQSIGLDIKSRQAIPVVYRRRLHIFWPVVTVVHDKLQSIPPAQASSQPTAFPSSSAPSSNRHVELQVGYSILGTDGQWTPAQVSAGRLYDVPPWDGAESDGGAGGAPDAAANIEAYYTLKTGLLNDIGDLYLDVFRLGAYTPYVVVTPASATPYKIDNTRAVHFGRALFDGRFGELQLSSMFVVVNPNEQNLLSYAQANYGPDARSLTPLTSPANDLTSDGGLVPQHGALVTPAQATNAAVPLSFDPVGSESNVGPLLHSSPAPYGVVGPNPDIPFDPASPFVYTDTKRSYFVTPARYYENGSIWSPVVPSDPTDTPYQLRYDFARFYHPYVQLFWHQLSVGGLSALYARTLQKSPDQVDVTGVDQFSFNTTYAPVVGRVRWGTDNEIIDFDLGAAYSGYNWELFFHAPLLLAQQLTQNQQFQQALDWFHFIFDPSTANSDPVPGRYWVTKPLAELTERGDLSTTREQPAATGRPARPYAGRRRVDMAGRSFRPLRHRETATRRLYETGRHELHRQPPWLGRPALHHGHQREPERSHPAVRSRQ